MRVDARYFRPTEVETLLGDPAKARQKLDWRPTVSFVELVQEMVSSDWELAKRDKLVADAGYRTLRHHE